MPSRQGLTSAPCSAGSASTTTVYLSPQRGRARFSYATVKAAAGSTDQSIPPPWMIPSRWQDSYANARCSSLETPPNPRNPARLVNFTPPTDPTRPTGSMSGRRFDRVGCPVITRKGPFTGRRRPLAGTLSSGQKVCVDQRVDGVPRPRVRPKKSRVSQPRSVQGFDPHGGSMSGNRL